MWWLFLVGGKSNDEKSKLALKTFQIHLLIQVSW
jgi:hypothetical protein